LWNLVEGRCGYIKRLQGGGDIVLWSPNGDRYAVVVHSTLTVYDASSSDVLCSKVHTLKVDIVVLMQIGIYQHIQSVVLLV
jgi:protein MAK11